MTRLRATLTLAAFCIVFAFGARGQEPGWDVDSGEMIGDSSLGVFTFTTNVVVRYGGAVLAADSVTVNEKTGEAEAHGNVRIQQNSQVWVGEHMRYNFKTHQMISEQFRTGKAPVYAEGRGLHGDLTNKVYNATGAMITADDFSSPSIKIRAKHIRIIPGQRIEATHATLYLGSVPVFYFPYYVRNLGPRANNFNFTPGYRNSFGAFLLGNYTWFINDQFDSILHLDYRQERGPGVGPDVNFHLGRWGDGALRYYYTHDDNAETNSVINAPVYENRQRVYFSWQANPYTNFNMKALVRYQSDMGVLHDFFETEYRNDPQPDTFVEANKFWRNFSLDVLAHPRLNDFYETVVRLPDVRLSGFRQQLGPTPLFYETENTMGYYRRLFAETNGFTPGTSFEAARADSFHQITIPETLFGWLNVTPRVGGRFTYYTEADGPGATTSQVSRGVFNTGGEVSFKLSQLWTGARSKAFELDGLRHIFEPSVNYVYVPAPNHQPDELPQFDYQLPSLSMLPIEFPGYNSIDSIDSQNVLRFGLGNKLQTKRKGRIEDFLNWQVYTDWRLTPATNQQTYGDLYSGLALRPWSWLTLQSQTRFDINQQDWRMLLHTVTIQPNNTWSWSLGQFYLRDDTNGPPSTALGPGNNLFTSSLSFRLSENWSFRASQHYDIRESRMAEQYYSIYRDMRSWTAVLTAGLRNNDDGPQDFLISFNFSFKARPRISPDSDSGPYSLLGR